MSKEKSMPSENMSKEDGVAWGGRSEVMKDPVGLYFIPSVIRSYERIGEGGDRIFIVVSEITQTAG